MLLGLAGAVKPLAERLWARVDRSGDCWLWLGSTQGGYGRLGVTVARGVVKVRHAHIVAWELEHGAKPPRMHLHHVCRNRACVRPAHLQLLTPAEHLKAHEADRPRLAPSPICRRGHEKEPGGTCRTCEVERVRRAPYPEACPEDHPLKGGNLVKLKRGRWRCRACRNAYAREYRRRRIEAGGGTVEPYGARLSLADCLDEE